MFEGLTKQLQSVFSRLRGQKTLTEENISDAVRQVRLALLEADVNYGVAGEFIKRVKEKALGGNILKSISPDQQFIKLVHDELAAFMGGAEALLDIGKKPSAIMVCGLQGSGKTTTCAKLAVHLMKDGKKRVLLAACDLQRPAAVEQLQKLGAAIGAPVFAAAGETNPLNAVKSACEEARKQGADVLIVDTAGRLHLDEELMRELEQVKAILSPQEVLFVANAMMGQDAVRTAAEFDKRVQITGTILTMLDGNARAGAAISIREVTGKPLKFEGVGEKPSDFQVFNPHSMADRILGMGDVINLVKKAEEAFDRESGEELQKKLRKALFTYEDYLKQMAMVKKLGSLKGIMKMLPGMGSLGDLDVPEKEFGKMEAMILSMTPSERQERVELTVSRRNRIAAGSGTKIDDVNRMVKGFKRMKQLFKDMPGLVNMKGMPGMKDLKNMSQNMGIDLGSMGRPRKK